MKIISHRGNLTGSQPELENQPTFILNALSLGYDCEIDVWVIDNKIYLGHDNPCYQTDLDFLKLPSLWCHAKNFRALEFMLENNVQCFWHQDDDRTITSSGFIWTHSKSEELGPRSIACWIDGVGNHPTNCYGICTDYPLRVNQSA